MFKSWIYGFQTFYSFDLTFICSALICKNSLIIRGFLHHFVFSTLFCLTLISFGKNYIHILFPKFLLKHYILIKKLTKLSQRNGSFGRNL
jgi:hypothetical protein